MKPRRYTIVIADRTTGATFRAASWNSRSPATDEVVEYERLALEREDGHLLGKALLPGEDLVAVGLPVDHGPAHLLADEEEYREGDACARRRDEPHGDGHDLWINPDDPRILAHADEPHADPSHLPTALLSAQIDAGWGMPYRFVDKSTLPVVFDERTSRLPTPWLLRLEGLEGQQRLYLSHLLRTKAPEDLVPPPPTGGQWFSERILQGADLLPGVRRLCQAALQAVSEG